MNKRIKEVRNDNGLSMRSFAKKLGLSVTSISRIESGENNPSRQTLLCICNQFGVNPDWLKNGEGPKHVTNINPSEISSWIIDQVQGDDDSFKARFMYALSHLPQEQWDMLENFMVRVLAENKNAPSEPELNKE